MANSKFRGAYSSNETPAEVAAAVSKQTKNLSRASGLDLSNPAPGGLFHAKDPEGDAAVKAGDRATGIGNKYTRADGSPRDAKAIADAKRLQGKG